MKSFNQLKWDVTEASSKKATPIEPSAIVTVRPSDMRHGKVGLTAMLHRHKKYRSGSESYDWTIQEPASNRKYHGTLKKNPEGGWIAMATDNKNKNRVIETDTSKNSLKALRKAYRSIAKASGSTPLGILIISRGNAKTKPLT